MPTLGVHSYVILLAFIEPRFYRHIVIWLASSHGWSLDTSYPSSSDLLYLCAKSFRYVMLPQPFGASVEIDWK